MPEKKIEQICDAIDELIINSERTCKLIASIRSKIRWAAQVIRISKVFLRGLDETIAKANGSWSFKGVELTQANIRDLRFWQRILKSTANEMTFDYFLRDPRMGHIHVWTDAATSDGTGIGGYTSTGFYFQVKWSDILQGKQWPEEGSTGPELLAVVVLFTYLKRHFKDKTVVIHCDNKGVIPMITKEKCSLRSEHHQQLLRYFAAECFDYRISYWAEHIPGVSNVEADRLSRFMSFPFIRFKIGKIAVDKHTYPFFDLNPNFSWDSTWNFKKLNITAHAQFCLNIMQP